MIVTVGGLNGVNNHDSEEKYITRESALFFCNHTLCTTIFIVHDSIVSTEKGGLSLSPPLFLDGDLKKFY
eukprot:m.99969 g.99969  ORF g.99969 m.99969 type:complete len:70 (+) comp9036_c4_seq1:586-795(+)